MEDIENKKWIEQIQNVRTRPKTPLIMGLYFFLIAPITVFMGTGVGIILLATFFGIVCFFPYWQPAFQIMRLIGNKEVSPILEKHKLRYYHFIILGIEIIFVLYMYYAGIEILLKKGIENLIH